MTTPNDIIKGALVLLGVQDPVESVDGDEASLLFDRLNRMIGGWSNKRPLIYADSLISHTLAAENGIYTIGTGADIDTTRPTQIKAAYIRSTGGQDYWLDIIDEIEYSKIYDKDIQTTYPEKLYYNPDYPIGTIKLWPYPSAAYTLYMEVTQPLTQFTSLAQTISLPEGYEEALEYNLAKRAGPSYGVAGTQDYQEIKMMADDMLADLKRANQANDMFEAEINAPSNNIGVYDIYSGRVV